MQDKAVFELRVEPRQPPVAQLRTTRASRRTAANATDSTNRFAHYLVRPILRLVPLTFTAVILAALYLGWINRDEGHLTAASGLGYWLGIVGGSMMLFMLLYPMRKRVKILRWLGSVPAWFRIHMILGILGPTLVLFHTNFRLGSLNSNVALAAMLTVVASGVIGRYLYAKVHRGLYGSTVEVREILGDADALKNALGDGLPNVEPLIEELRVFEAKVLAPRRSLLASFWSYLTVGVLIGLGQRRLLRHAKRIVASEALAGDWSWCQKRARSKAVRERLTLYFSAVRKAARFAVYERLLALWHVLHMPLFVLLVITAVIHVVAVHQY